MYTLAEHIVAMRGYLGTLENLFGLIDGHPRATLPLSALKMVEQEVEALWQLSQSKFDELPASLVVAQFLRGEEFFTRVHALQDVVAPVVQQLANIARDCKLKHRRTRLALAGNSKPVAVDFTGDITFAESAAGAWAGMQEAAADALLRQVCLVEQMFEPLIVMLQAARLGALSMAMPASR